LASYVGRQELTNLFPHPIKVQSVPTPIDYSQVPATPASIAGLASQHVMAAITAARTDAQYDPIGPTTHFYAGGTVYVIVQVRGLAKTAQHTLSVRWYLAGKDIGVQGLADAKTSTPIKGNTNAAFGLVYPAPGVGMARIYWDRPLTDTNDTSSDPSLARTVMFGVFQPTPTPTPTQTPTSGKATGTPSLTRAPTPTPTK
jgi:hypothetical protein